MNDKFFEEVNKLIQDEIENAPRAEIATFAKESNAISVEKVNQFRNITQRALAKHRQARFEEVVEKRNLSAQSNMFEKALAKIPENVDLMFQQILGVIQLRGGDFSLAHRNEENGKSNDEEMKRIWVRMEMLGLFDQEDRG